MHKSLIMSVFLKLHNRSFLCGNLLMFHAYNTVKDVIDLDSLQKQTTMEVIEPTVIF